jgi:hypothetical protein
MSFKTFTSPNGDFSLSLPTDWDEYDDGDNETYAFFNAKAWTGNLRITPFYWANLVNPNEDKAADLISEELAENKDARKIKLGNFDCAYYKKHIVQDGDELVIYYWIAGKNSDLFTCSFTINKEQESTKENEIELKKVEDIIKSIKVKPIFNQ